MGLTLQGCQIDLTYPGLLKTCDNSTVTSTYKPVTDGCGNDIPLSVSSLGTRFGGAVDFSGASVTGLPDQDTTYTISSAQDAANAVINLDGSDASNSKVTLVAGTNITLTDDGLNNVTIDASGGAAGLVSGTGVDSLKNADSLVTVAANAAGTCSIALGNAAVASGTDTVAIGNGARATGYERSISIGLNACDAGLHKGISIGANTKSGCSANGTYRGMAIGDSAQGTGGESIAIGLSANTCLYAYGIALGRGTCTTAPHAIAIGANVSASRACALTTCEIELCAPGGGLYLTTPDGLAQPKLSVDNTSQLLVDGTPIGGTDTTYDLASCQNGTNVDVQLTGSDATVDTVQLIAGTNITLTDNGTNGITIDAAGGGGAAGLVSGIGAGSMQSNASLTTLPANALGDCSIALGNSATAGGQGVAIGDSANGGGLGISIGYLTNTDVYGIALGYLSRTIGFKSVAIGSQAEAKQACSIAIGESSEANAARSVAIGKNIIATRADALTTCELVACAVGKGLIVTSPDGLTTLGIGIDNAGNIVTYTP